jgi:hypothetical protein
MLTAINIAHAVAHSLTAFTSLLMVIVLDMIVVALADDDFPSNDASLCTTGQERHLCSSPAVVHNDTHLTSEPFAGASAFDIHCMFEVCTMQRARFRTTQRRTLILVSAGVI